MPAEMNEIKRIAMGIRYDGANYHGWQAQDIDIPTLQARVEHALTRVANHPVNVVCAGRTDAGVHASQQVIHFDTEADRRPDSWVFGTNSNLPNDISAMWAVPVESDFHARFSATSRRYRYVMYNYSVRPGIMRNAVGWYYKELDIALMQKAAMHFIGEHDFTSFRGAGCQANSPVRTITEFAISRREHLIVFDIQANAFLLHMVRNMVGSLTAVGAGLQDPDWIKTVLDARDRSKAGVTASPTGLYLVAVDYPEVFSLPKMPLGPFFLHGAVL